MALICDPDYLIHSIRLNYLRHVDDPYGPRIISFNSRYTSNSRIQTSGLADEEKWPELRMPQSPEVSDDEAAAGPSGGRRVRTGFPGASGLKHTQTIMGPNRMGAAGLRVTGRRIAPEKEVARRSISSMSATPRRTRAGSEPTPNSSSPIPDGSPNSSQDTHDSSLIQVSKRRSVGGSSLSEVPTTLIEKPEALALAVEKEKEESQLVPNAPMALQSMSHIAAMQARRQRRRAHFSSAGGAAAKPIITSEPRLNPELSSDEESGIMSGSLADDDFMIEVEGSLDVENDEFDPDFAPPRIAVNSDVSDNANSMSNSVLSTSISSAYNSLQIGTGIQNRGKLSPVHESHSSDYHGTTEEVSGGVKDTSSLTDNTSNTDTSTIDDYFEIVKPARPAVPQMTRSSQSRKAGQSTKPPSPDEPFFKRVKVPSARSAASALTAKLASTNTSSNPFSELYALISGRAETASMEVIVFFPHATKPVNKPMKLSVRKDATVEETIGFSLWSFWEEGWLPKLDEGLNDEQKKTKLSGVGWVLRIAEDDGEVDEDFPAPDRSRKISDFNFDAYAVLEATPAQATQNAQLEAKINRRPSRIIVSKRKVEAPTTLAPPAPPLGTSTSTLSASNLGTSFTPLSSSLNVSSSHGSQILLRIRVASAETAKALLLSSTVSVNSTMYMQEVLELVCRKRKEDSKDWALLSDNCDALVYLDRTVASLEGNTRLVLVPRSQLPHYGFAVDGDRRTGRSVDPNASIFKQISEVHPKEKKVDPDLNVYKRFSVFRKVPMLVGRLERTLAIDGDYIHIMPSANKARGVFDSGKTVSYHIKAVSSYGQSAKSSASFKIIFKRDAGDKRYDFEAESARLAAEIVTTIKAMRVKGGLERSGTLHRSKRRSQRV